MISLDTIRRIRQEVRLHEGGSEDPAIAGGQCGIVSEEIAVQFGWQECYGRYVLLDGSVCDDHAWNYLPDGSILDATADQFGEGHDIRIVRPTDTDFQRYQA